MPVYPGVATATEIEAALEGGLKLLKLWPISLWWRRVNLNLLSGPFGGVEFNPSGGVTGANFESYLALKNVVACGGSWMAPPDWIAAKQFDRVSSAVRDQTKAARLTPARKTPTTPRPGIQEAARSR